MFRATIAILNWNAARYVRACLESVFWQTEPNLELIVVDNCSTDGSRELIATILTESPFPHQFISLDSNRGISGGLNFALEKSRGEYFFPFASDDEMCVDRVKVQCELLDEAGPDYGIGAGAVKRIGPDGDPIVTSRGAHKVVRPARYGSARRTRHMALRGSIPPAPGMMFRTSALRCAGGYDPLAVVEDHETFTRLTVVHGFRVARTSRVVALYRIHNLNTSRNTDLLRDGAIYASRKILQSGALSMSESRRISRALADRERYDVTRYGQLLDALRREPTNSFVVRSYALRALFSPSLRIRFRLRAAYAVITPVRARQRIRIYEQGSTPAMKVDHK